MQAGTRNLSGIQTQVATFPVIISWKGVEIFDSFQMRKTIWAVMWKWLLNKNLLVMSRYCTLIKIVHKQSKECFQQHIRLKRGTSVQRDSLHLLLRLTLLRLSLCFHLLWSFLSLFSNLLYPPGLFCYHASIFLSLLNHLSLLSLAFLSPLSSSRGHFSLILSTFTTQPLKQELMEQNCDWRDRQRDVDQVHVSLRGVEGGH